MMGDLVSKLLVWLAKDSSATGIQRLMVVLGIPCIVVAVMVIESAITHHAADFHAMQQSVGRIESTISTWPEQERRAERQFDELMSMYRGQGARIDQIEGRLDRRMAP